LDFQWAEAASALSLGDFEVPVLKNGTAFAPVAFLGEVQVHSDSKIRCADRRLS